MSTDLLAARQFRHHLTAAKHILDRTEPFDGRELLKTRLNDILENVWQGGAYIFLPPDEATCPICGCDVKMP
jgi:hypothetical protein